jgi:hypothetical protein
MTKRGAIAIAIILIVGGGIWGGVALYQNHAAAAAEPTLSLPSGYLKASPSFLREFDAAVAEQNKFQTMVQKLNGRIPQGYQFDQQFRAFKPLPAAPTSTPVPGLPPAPAPKPEPKKP